MDCHLQLVKDKITFIYCAGVMNQILDDTPYNIKRNFGDYSQITGPYHQVGNHWILWFAKYTLTVGFIYCLDSLNRVTQPELNNTF